MDIIITKKVPKRVPVLEGDGTQVKEKGVPKFKDEIELVPVTFEAHPQELISSIANRFIKAEKLPAPPGSIVPVLKDAVRGTTFMPEMTLKQTGSVTFVIAGLEPRAKA